MEGKALGLMISVPALSSLSLPFGEALNEPVFLQGWTHLLVCC